MNSGELFDIFLKILYWLKFGNYVKKKFFEIIYLKFVDFDNFFVLKIFEIKLYVFLLI